MIREAVSADVPALARIEERCFGSDRLSIRSFRHILAHGHADLLVDEDGEGCLRAYSLVFYRRGSPRARLYSFAVDPDFQGRGIGRVLLNEAEACAASRGTLAMRLEVRRDNRAARSLYSGLGYRPFESIDGYYHDGMAAIRMEKALNLPAHINSLSRSTRDFPHRAVLTAQEAERD